MALIAKPFKQRVSFPLYLETVRQMANSSNDRVNPKNSPLFTGYRCINYILYLKAAHHLYLGLAAPQSALDRLLTFDLVEVLVPRGLINYSGTVCALTVIYYNQVLFLDMNYSLLEQLGKVLVGRGASPFGEVREFRGWQVEVLVRRIYAGIFNAIDSFTAVVGKFLFFVVNYKKFKIFVLDIMILFFHAFFLYQLENQFSFFSVNFTPLKAFKLICLHFSSAFSFWLLCFNFTLVYSLAFSTLFSFLALFYIKMEQLRGQLEGYLHLLLCRNGSSSKSNKRRKSIQRKGRSPKKRFVKRTFTFTTTFTREFITTTTTFARVNRLYCWLFLAACIFQVPQSAMLSLSLVFGRIPPSSRPPVLFAIFNNYFLIFALHFALALPSRAFDQLGRLLHRLAVYSNYCTQNCNHKSENEKENTNTKKQNWNAKNSLRLGRLVWAFCGENRYGCTYGDFGLVQTSTFFKVTVNKIYFFI